MTVGLRDRDLLTAHVRLSGGLPFVIAGPPRSGRSAALRMLARQAPAAGLIVEDAYTSVADRGQEVFPFLPIKLIAKSRFASIEKVGALELPKLFLHALHDQTIPIEHGRAVFAAAREPKTFVELESVKKRCATIRCRSSFARVIAT